MVDEQATGRRRSKTVESAATASHVRRAPERKAKMSRGDALCARLASAVDQEIVRLEAELAQAEAEGADKRARLVAALVKAVEAVCELEERARANACAESAHDRDALAAELERRLSRLIAAADAGDGAGGNEPEGD